MSQVIQPSSDAAATALAIAYEIVARMQDPKNDQEALDRAKLVRELWAQIYRGKSVGPG